MRTKVIKKLIISLLVVAILSLIIMPFFTGCDVVLADDQKTSSQELADTAANVLGALPRTYFMDC